MKTFNFTFLSSHVAFLLQVLLPSTGGQHHAFRHLNTSLIKPGSLQYCYMLPANLSGVVETDL